jgi:methylenetetrahydrofolate dehydrogenase (NADP+)/methenyltetrahydrofolate cyclohydrolase
VRSELHELPGTITESALLDRVRALNEDPRVHGILVQMPLPKHIARQASSRRVPAKDVDGFHPANLGALVAGLPAVAPCTPAGVMRMLASEGVALEGATRWSSAARRSSASRWRCCSCSAMRR